MYHVTSSIYTENPPPVQLVILLGWGNYNSKNSKPNGSANLFEKKSFYLFDSANIARTCTCQSLHRNPPPTSKDQLAGDAHGILINGNSTSTPTLAVFHTLTLVMSCILTFASALTLSSSSQLFKQFIKAYLGAQTQLASSKAWEKALNKLFKARNPNLYYENLYIKCYYFCCQCKNHFEIASAKGQKRVSFGVLFLWKRINFCWQ